MKLENEGWERDYDVTEPTEPEFTEPEWSHAWRGRQPDRPGLLARG